MKQTKKPDEADQHIAKRLQERRLELGVSQEKLAEHLEISFQQVQKYENGKNRISAGRLFSASQFLGVPFGYFSEGLSGTAPGFREDDVQQPFLHAPTSEMGELARHFAQLRSPAVRRSVLDLVRSLALTSQDEADKPRK